MLQSMHAFTTAQIVRGLEAINQTPTSERPRLVGWMETWTTNLREKEVSERAGVSDQIDSPEDFLKFVYDQGWITGFDCPTGYRLTDKAKKLMTEHGRPVA